MDQPQRGLIHLVLMDQEQFYLEPLAERLNTEPDMRVILFGSDCRGTIDACLHSTPEVAVIDVDQKQCGPFEVAEEIRSRQRKTRFLFLAHQQSDITIEQALRVHAFGYILKSEPLSFLLEAIRRINRGDYCFSASVEERLTYNREKHTWSMRTQSGLSGLTNRQLEVLRYLAVGKSVKEVAKLMHLSEKSVDSHKYRIMNKLNIHDRVELARFAIREKLVEA